MKRLDVRLLLVGFALWSSLLSAAEVMLRVRPHVVVAPASEVRLIQLVDAQGMSAAARTQMEQVILSLAPAAGERQELANGALTSVLRPIVQAERERTQHSVHLIVPKSIVVDTVKREIAVEDVQAELFQAWSPLCADCRLEIEGLSLPRVGELRDWTMKIPAELPRGSFSVPVEVVTQQGAKISAWISGRLLVKRLVPVVKRLLAPGERVQIKDIAWEYRDTSFAYDGVPTEEELAGKRLRQGVRSNDILWRSLLEKEKAIARGDLVTVRSAEGTWEVSMTLVAERDAYLGDVVNLKHPKTKTQMVGQVVRQGEVELR